MHMYVVCFYVHVCFIFLIYNIFVMFDGCVFQQTVGIPIGTNCDPPTSSFIDCMRQTLYRGFSRKTKRSYPDSLISRYTI